MTEQDVVRSLYEVIPGYSLHMEEFLRLFRVRFEEKRVDSAAMTCGDRPELLLNPKFLEERCKTPEHLLMLVLHELYHALLGHTRLFLHPTKIDNIAFDAVINATLVRAFPGEEFRSFFEGNNPSGSFPGCLLRPAAEDTPEDCRDLVEALYLGNHVTYEEIYDLIVRKMMEGGLPEGGFLLIGDHRGAGKGSPMLRKALEKAMGGWPDGLLKVGRSADGDKTMLSLVPEDPHEKKGRAKRRKLLRLVLEPKGPWRSRLEEEERERETFLPDPRDRRRAAYEALGFDPLLHRSSGRSPLLRRERKEEALVYLDVSGSVLGQVERLLPLLREPFREGRLRLFAFSSEVEEISYQDFLAGRFPSTRATSIQAVFEHFLSLPSSRRPGRLLVLSDGLFGDVEEEQEKRLKGTRVALGLFGERQVEAFPGIFRHVEVFE